MRISLNVNGVRHEADVEPRTLLVHFLREDLRLTGTHVGCDTSQCGACTIPTTTSMPTPPTSANWPACTPDGRCNKPPNGFSAPDGLAQQYGQAPVCCLIAGA